MTEYISPIKTIQAPAERIFGKLSDLSNLRSVADKFSEDEFSLESYDTDSCTIRLKPMGRVSLCVVEREAHKMIKMQTEQSPFSFTLWIQLVEVAPDDTRMKLTLRAELNLFIKKMAGSRIEEAVDKLADVLAAIPY